jgi:hypothetical protein
MNMEKAMLDNFDYRPVFVGGFLNPQEPNVPDSGDGAGVDVDSQVAYVEGDWYHVGQDNGNSRHISEIEEIGMVEQGDNFENTSASELGVSVLGEFERGNTDLLDGFQDPEEYVETAVTSPVTLNGNMTELELSDDISWQILNSIRENSEWTETMASLELATAIGSEIDGNVEVEGETPESSRIRIR